MLTSAFIEKGKIILTGTLAKVNSYTPDLIKSY